jgi:hypothetical protein
MSSRAKYIVDEFGISASLKQYVEGAESRTSSKKGESEKFRTKYGIGPISNLSPGTFITGTQHPFLARVFLTNCIQMQMRSL